MKTASKADLAVFNERLALGFYEKHEGYSKNQMTD